MHVPRGAVRTTKVYILNGFLQNRSDKPFILLQIYPSLINPFPIFTSPKGLQHLFSVGPDCDSHGVWWLCACRKRQLVPLRPSLLVVENGSRLSYKAPHSYYTAPTGPHSHITGSLFMMMARAKTTGIQALFWTAVWFVWKRFQFRLHPLHTKIATLNHLTHK